MPSNAEALFNELKDMLQKVIIDGGEFYVAEGDLLLDVDELWQYAHQRISLKEIERLRLGSEGGVGIVPRLSPQLVGIIQGGKIVRWDPSVELSYCVLRKTFWDQAQYEEVRDNMVAATRDWEGTCGVKFEYKQEHDESPKHRPDDVLFPVRGFDANGEFIASAFFPHYPSYRRRILIDPSYFQTSFDRIGVMRHELGHVLGFRHEHIRSGAPPICPDESTASSFDLTPYDPQSCMHYFCGGVGSRALAISELDKVGSRKIYGLPLSLLSFAK